MIKIGIKGSGVSAFMSAKLLLDTKSNEFALHFYDIIENNITPRYVFLTPVSTKILLDLFPVLKIHFKDLGVKIYKHTSSINNELRSHEYSNTWMININLISKFMSESIKELLTHLNYKENRPIASSQCDINIIATGKKIYLENRIYFGERKILSVEVTTTENLFQTYFETTNETWLYLAPVNSNKAILQIAIPNSSYSNSDFYLKTIDKTLLIKHVISAITGSLHDANSSPSILSVHPDYGILTGDALVSYDPVSGYGLMNTMRSTILCIALIKQTIKSNTFSKDAYKYYMNRNTFSLLTHLQECVTLYSKINYEVWKKDIALMNDGITYLKYLMDYNFTYSGKYHLKGFELYEQSNAI